MCDNATCTRNSRETASAAQKVALNPTGVSLMLYDIFFLQLRAEYALLHEQMICVYQHFGDPERSVGM